MKRCPECGRDYNDDSMSFCLDDGSELLFGPASMDEPATAILSEPGAIATGSPDDEHQTAVLHSTAAPGDAPTRAQIHTTEQTAIFSREAEAEPQSKVGASPEKQSFSARRMEKPLAKPLIAAAVAIAVIAFGGFFAYRYLNPTGSGQINSIAVLPFENRSGNADSEYLSDGLAESLIYRLSQLPGLKVSPTNSVLRYKGQLSDITVIAKELEVDAVMTGRLAQRGDDLTISVELTDARTKKLIWAEQYVRKMSDLLATQREIASAVTQKLELKLSGDDTKGLTKSYTNDNEAYQLYLKGRFYWNTRTRAGLKTAIEQFKAASEKDPSFALAYVGMADSYLVGTYNERGTDKEAVKMAKAYATRALEIDPSLAEPHATMGLVNHYLWNWAEAERYYKRALELNPNYPTTRHWYSRTLRQIGRYEEAFEMIKRAEEADPLSLAISNNVGENLLEKGDIAGAIEKARRTTEIGSSWVPYRTLAHCYLRLGHKEEALGDARKAAEFLDGSPVTLKVLGYVQGAIGNRAEALAIAKEIEAKFSKGEADGRDVAVVYAGLGENDKVFEWLEKDFQNRSSSLAEMRLEIPFVPLRSDPRFKDLARRMGLPE